jgi:hypothetical protein
MTAQVKFKPTETEILILANQAAMATAMAYLCQISGGDGHRFASIMDKISINTHKYLKRYE